MDKRRAIEFLGYLLRDKNIERTIYEDALKIAIESLKAQLSKENTTKDAISRQAAIDALCSKCTVDKPETCSTIQKGDNWCEEVYILQNVPSVQPEVRNGKWALGFDNKYMEKYYYCSRCGCRKYGEYKPLDYFCSNCGATMILPK